METSKKQANLIIFDVGSTYTKATALYLGDYIQFIQRAQAPTTVDDILVGVENAKKELLALGTVFAEDTRILSTSSAAGGLRMVALGYMPRVTAKAAKEVAMNAGAKVLEVLSYNDSVEYREEVLQEIRPDIILLAGGTDGGDTSSVIENAEIICRHGGEAITIYAGNKEVQQDVIDILAEHGKKYSVVGNVMPTIHTLNVKPAREIIHGEFIKQITKAKGLAQMLEIISNNKVIPTPGAVLLGAELLAKGTYKEHGLESVIIVDLGGATTDIHSVLAENEDLSSEEAGLIINNEKQPTYRTVEGNLGMRVSATGILESVGAEAVLSKIGLSGEDNIEIITNYCKFLEKEPEHLASNDAEMGFDLALASTAVEVGLKRHAGFFAQEFNPVLGIIPGVAIGRDLRKAKYVIGVGGIFTHSEPSRSNEILDLATKNPGISLLPEKPEILIDTNYLVYTIGVLAEVDPDKALLFAKDYFGIKRKPKDQSIIK